MPSKSLNNNKNVQKELEKTISPVLVVNNSSLKPYVELFNYAPENIYQQPLGSLVGFFEVKEYSEESAYIVNFLTSVLKKEYYINPKRPVEESLDSALHKVNMALSELAKHGNIEWLGKLHAAICVLEKNSAHFSVAGGAKLFLFRNNTLTDISEDLASDDLEPHPLKTFVNVSSGKLEKNDRLLITSEDIFHILSANDLRKNFQRFEGEKFVQFLKTALSNQMEMIASLIIGLEEQQTVAKNKSKSKKIIAGTDNVFSEKTFANNQTMVTAEEFDTEEENDKKANTEEGAYRDEKTGHIYIQGQVNELHEITKTQLFLEIAKEKMAQGWYASKVATRRNYILQKKQLTKKIENWRAERARMAEIKAEQQKIKDEEERIRQAELEELRIQQEQEENIRQAELAKIQEKEEAEKTELAELEAAKQQQEIAQLVEQENLEAKMHGNETNQPIPEANNVIQGGEKKMSFQEKLELMKKQQQQRNAVIDLRPKAKLSIEEPTLVQPEISEDERQPEEYSELPVKISLVEPQSKLIQIAKKAETIIVKHGKQIQKAGLMLCETIKKTSAKDKQKQANDFVQPQRQFTPRFSKILILFRGFSIKQKTYTFLGLILIFVVPFFIARWINKPKPHAITELPSVAVVPGQQLANEKNINLNTEQKTVLNGSDIIETLITKDGTTIIKQNSVVVLSENNKKQYPLPESSSAKKATYMADLSLVFILTDKNKLISFSPASTKFTDNNIELPSGISSDLLGTYLTYLYVLDQDNNQIYRYPRATGGFGEKTNWYKDKNSLAEVSSMTIDDNIYAVQNNQVIKLFKGEAQSFTLEKSNTPVQINQIFTTLDSKSLWILDSKNSRLVEYNKSDGSIAKQYFNETLKNATSFSVDEKTHTAYVITSSGLISIELQ